MIVDAIPRSSARRFNLCVRDPLFGLKSPKGFSLCRPGKHTAPIVNAPKTGGRALRPERPPHAGAPALPERLSAAEIRLFGGRNPLRRGREPRPGKGPQGGLGGAPPRTVPRGPRHRGQVRTAARARTGARLRGPHPENPEIRRENPPSGADRRALAPRARPSLGQAERLAM